MVGPIYDMHSSWWTDMFLTLSLSWHWPMHIMLSMSAENTGSAGMIDLAQTGSTLLFWNTSVSTSTYVRRKGVWSCNHELFITLCMGPWWWSCHGTTHLSMWCSTPWGTCYCACHHPRIAQGLMDKVLYRWAHLQCQFLRCCCWPHWKSQQPYWVPCLAFCLCKQSMNGLDLQLLVQVTLYRETWGKMDTHKCYRCLYLQSLNNKQHVCWMHLASTHDEGHGDCCA